MRLLPGPMHGTCSKARGAACLQGSRSSRGAKHLHSYRMTAWQPRPAQCAPPSMCERACVRACMHPEHAATERHGHAWRRLACGPAARRRHGRRPQSAAAPAQPSMPHKRSTLNPGPCRMACAHTWVRARPQHITQQRASIGCPCTLFLGACECMLTHGSPHLLSLDHVHIALVLAPAAAAISGLGKQRIAFQHTGPTLREPRHLHGAAWHARLLGGHAHPHCSSPSAQAAAPASPPIGIRWMHHADGCPCSCKQIKRSFNAAACARTRAGRGFGSSHACMHVCFRDVHTHMRKLTSSARKRVPALLRVVSSKS